MCLLIIIFNKDHKNVHKSSKSFNPSTLYKISIGKGRTLQKHFFPVQGSQGTVEKCTAAIFFPGRITDMTWTLP